MTSKPYACLFPGQGAHTIEMLDGVCHAPAFAERYALVCQALDTDVASALTEQQHDFLNRNAVSSLLTVLVSTLSYDLWLAHMPPPAYLAGYSVGQWTALYAAGVVPFPLLVNLVKTRAALMDACIAQTPGGMIGVIGLGETAIQDLVAQLQAEGHQVAISNYNCLGQYSLAAAAAAMRPTLQALQAREPRKVLTLPVAGAWHSSLLQPAEAPFAAYLATVPLAPAACPVIDNVMGQLLPTSDAELKAQLVKQLSAPVRWQQGVETLIGLGCERFVEIGYGKLLTKFGFFINRAYAHEAFYA